MAIYVSFVTAPYAAPGTEMAMLLLYNGLGVVGKEKFNNTLAQPVEVFASGGDDHSFTGRGGGGRDRFTVSVDFHQTEATGTVGLEPRIIAEGRNVDFQLLGGLKDRFSFGDLNLNTINCHLNITTM
jgi:hypothetical protein